MEWSPRWSQRTMNDASIFLKWADVCAEEPPTSSSRDRELKNTASASRLHAARALFYDLQPVLSHIKLSNSKGKLLRKSKQVPHFSPAKNNVKSSSTCRSNFLVAKTHNMDSSEERKVNLESSNLESETMPSTSEVLELFWRFALSDALGGCRWYNQL